MSVLTAKGTVVYVQPNTYKNREGQEVTTQVVDLKQGNERFATTIQGLPNDEKIEVGQVIEVAVGVGAFNDKSGKAIPRLYYVKS